MKSTRIIALLLAVVTLAATLVGCGSTAYDEPTKYLELPTNFGALTVTAADLKKEIDDKIKSTRDESAGQVFEPVADKDATVQKGDQVYISFKGTTSKELSDTVKENLSNDNFFLTIGANNSTFPIDYTNKNDNNSDNDKDDESVIVAGIETQLIGKKAGEKVTLTGRFSNSYGTEDLKNVDVTYEIEIKAIARVSVTTDFKVKVTYTFFEKEEDVKTDILPVITKAPETTVAPTTTATPETTTAPATTVAPETTVAPATTAAPTTTAAPSTTAKKPTFAELFPSVTDTSKATELDLSKKTTSFATVFTLEDLIPYFEGKGLYNEFAIKLTVPASISASTDEKYADYLGKDVYVSFKIESTTSTPEWTDYFINRVTITAEDEENRFATTKAYEEYLEKEIAKSLAYDAILEASKVTKMPKDEWKISYENYLEQYVCEYLAEVDKVSGGVTLDDYTPSEIEKKISEAKYDELRQKASVSAQKSVKQRLTMEALFEKFDIKLSKSEFNSKMKEEEEQFNANIWTYYYYYQIYTFDQYVSYYGGEEYFRLEWKYDKLLDVLPTSGVVIEKISEDTAE